MAKLQPLQPVVPMVRPPPIHALSPFEHLLQGKERPTSMLIHIFHTSFFDSNPADHLITVLPSSSILALRAVSSTTKAWVEEHYPALLKSLRVTCPLPRFSVQASSTLRHLARECTHLTINVLPCATPIPAGSVFKPTPSSQLFKIRWGFSTLRIELPPNDAFEPLLSLRRGLEAVSLQFLTEIHFEALSVMGLLALRWGGFDATKESTWIGGNFWRGLKSLRISMKIDGFEYNDAELHAEQNADRITMLKGKREIYRHSVQILHNYFFHYSLNGRLEKLRFDWIGGTGPNPLLLDEEVAEEVDGWKWFSAPGIVWKGLKEVWLGGVRVQGAHVKDMKQRMEGLENLVVWEDMAAIEIGGETKKVQGKEWLEIDLAADIIEVLGDIEDLFNETDVGRGEIGESIVVTFVLRL
ncbi:MAG: hypothetical protein Q9201_003493 [Fulgogasparrea decipioides]